MRTRTSIYLHLLDYVKIKDSSKNEEVQDRSEQEIIEHIEDIHENPKMRNIDRKNTETAEDPDNIDHDMIEEDNIKAKTLKRNENDETF
ncbi:hypothetical protein JTB14_035928 [Gonioctena quinquepunctata]|nr:hypothetical protein JTB14_035928 [Gonioctena quinquepunctata]